MPKTTKEIYMHKSIKIMLIAAALSSEVSASDLDFSNSFDSEEFSSDVQNTDIALAETLPAEARRVALLPAELEEEQPLSWLELELFYKHVVNSAFSDAAIIKNSYIVSFKAPKEGQLSVVWPPQKRSTPVPFGEHSSGQNKEDLAVEINLKGQLVSIFDSINAIHIRTNQREALRLALDKRVNAVEQDFTSSTASPDTLTDNNIIDAKELELSVLEQTLYNENIRNSQLSNEITVKNAYFVAFKSPAEGVNPIIWPPQNTSTPVPSGEHSSGQNKEDLARLISLRGEVVSIFDNINSIYVKVTPREALRLALDENVKYVEQDIILTPEGLNIPLPEEIATFNTPPLTELEIPQLDEIETQLFHKLVINSDLPENMIVKHSYIVTFKEPKEGAQPIVWQPNKALPAPLFGEHSSGQDKAVLAQQIGLQGELVSIFDNSNAIHIRTHKKEALRLILNEHVDSVEQDIKTIISATTSPTESWGLDRIDENLAINDSTYNDSFTGAGRNIYILDTGLNMSNPIVAAEFDHWRAAIVWDVNSTIPKAQDCNGHGTQVSSIIAGNTYGVAKDALIHMAKITNGCSESADLTASLRAFNWLTTHAGAGSIINWGFTLSNNETYCTNETRNDVKNKPLFVSPKLEQAVREAHNAGIMVVVAAGNDNCDTSRFSPTNIPEAFVVGATNNKGFPNTDRKTIFSRTGANIATFAPGKDVLSMDKDGEPTLSNGTSFSAAYITGLFATACEAADTYLYAYCESKNTAGLYSALKTFGGTIGTVTDSDGTPLTGATSRFISQKW